jgi:5-methylcytosine-specific restriction enzyme subunit McrC
LNQTLKFVSSGLYGITNEPSNKKRLRKCLALFDEVDNVRVTKRQAESIYLTRLNKRFENLLMLAKLFLGNQTLVAKSGRHESWTILIDMNVLFEEFIAEALERGLHNSSYKVMSQGPRAKFVRNIDDDREVFTTKPDISILQNKNVVKIADTKYKKLAEDDTKYGVSQPDLYQMFAYSRKYKTPDITLIYPKTNGVLPHTLELPDETRVHVRSINLERNLRKEIKAIENEVVAMFRREKMEVAYE